MLVCGAALISAVASSAQGQEFTWTPFTQLPNELGVAGPFVGVSGDVLIVAGGANFPRPVWETSKVWCDDIFILERVGEDLKWRNGGRLPRPDR